MNNQICLPTFYFTLLIFTFVMALAWGFFNLLQMQPQPTTTYQPPIYTPPAHPEVPVPTEPVPSPPPRISKDDADDLALGERPSRRRDYRRLYDPLKEPARRYVRYPDGGYIPGGNINIPTQGYLPSYQNMGYLATDKEGPGKLLKLFGRRLDTYRYEYYVTHHKDPTLKVPLEIKSDKELMEGDTVHVPGYQADYKVTLYEFEAPKYIPYL